LVKQGFEEISKDSYITKAIGDLNEVLHCLLKDPIIIKKIIHEDNGIGIEKDILEVCLLALDEMQKTKGLDPFDIYDLNTKIEAKNEYVLSYQPITKA